MTSQSRLLGRFAWVGLIAFGLGILAVGLWSTGETLRATDETRRLVTLSDGWKQARFWVAEEETLERKYRIERLHHDGLYHDKIVALLTSTVLRLRPYTRPDGQAAIDRLLTANARYVLAMHRMFAAVDAGDEQRVEAIHDAIDPTYDLVEHIAVAQETIYHRLAYLGLARLEKTQRVVATAFPWLMGLGLLAIGAFLLVIREYRRKADELLQLQLERLSRAALDDPLTGLGNGRAFRERLQRRTEAPAGESFHLALIDIDHFKKVNDRFGHLHGDLVLRTLGGMLAEPRAGAGAYRIGGDEFALIFEGPSLGAVRAELQGLRDSTRSRLVGNTISIGLASLASDGTDLGALHECADVALYEAKHRGRDSVVEFEPELLETSHSLAARRIALDRVLASEGTPAILFQPVWALDGSLIGCEALARFGGEFVSPAEAFSVAERLDRAAELDARCLMSVARAVPAGLAGSLFVNLSPTTLARGDLAIVALERLCRESGLSPDRIVVEITEQIPIAAAAVAAAARLRERGFRIALDDTGSGNAGLAILATVPLDVVKVDGSLVAALAMEERARAIVSGIFVMAAGLDVRVVVEGVETADHARLCAELAADCRIAGRLGLQGCFLGRPAAASALPDPLFAHAALAGALHSADRR